MNWVVNLCVIVTGLHGTTPACPNRDSPGAR